jgi:hypothetical protein
MNKIITYIFIPIVVVCLWLPLYFLSGVLKKAFDAVDEFIKAVIWFTKEE